jgi:hypothetical protein
LLLIIHYFALDYLNVKFSIRYLMNKHQYLIFLHLNLNQIIDILNPYLYKADKNKKASYRVLSRQQYSKPLVHCAIPAVQYIINTTPNTITGFTPFELLFGPAVNPHRLRLSPSESSKSLPKNKMTWWDETQCP